MADLLENLIQSKVKRKLLKLFLFNKNKKYHVRELSRVIEEPISAVQRELKKLIALQLIIRMPEGNIINYFGNTQNPFYDELRTLIIKTTTEPKEYFKMLVNSKYLEVVALYGETVKTPMKYCQAVNLLVVGTLGEEVLHEYIKAIMEIFKRDYVLFYVDSKNYKTSLETDKKLSSIINSKNILYLKQTNL